jgi:hypothetical protein
MVGELKLLLRYGGVLKWGGVPEIIQNSWTVYTILYIIYHLVI